MSGSWQCTACGFKNQQKNAVCGGQGGRLGCKAPRTDDAPAIPDKPTPMPGDWACPACGFSNFARNQTCKKCNTAKVGGGGAEWGQGTPFVPYAPPAVASAGTPYGSPPPRAPIPVRVVARGKPPEAVVVSMSVKVTAKVPHGAGPGVDVSVSPPGYEEMHVPIPAGVNPGDLIEIDVPCHQPAPQAPPAYIPQQPAPQMQVQWHGQPKGGKGGPAGGAPGSSWQCTSCGFKNSPKNSVCGGDGGRLGCKAPRTADAPAIPDKPQPRPGDWSCSACGFSNFAKNAVCKKCGAAQASDS